MNAFRVTARGRRGHTPGVMNQTEERYAEHLKQRKIAGEIEEFWFEPFKLKLAPRTSYTADFLVMLPDGLLEVHEVKGIWEDDARAKFKIAASMFPFRFIAIKMLPRHGGWQIEEF